MIKEAITKIVNKEDLSYDEAYQVMSEIMSGETTPTQNAAFLAALSTKSTKSETIDSRHGRRQRGLHQHLDHRRYHHRSSGHSRLKTRQQSRQLKMRCRRLPRSLGREHRPRPRQVREAP